MKKLLAATLLAASFATPALSADMAVKARPMAVVAAYDWSGLYVGGAMGGTFGRVDDNYSTISSAPPTSTHFSRFTGSALAGFQKQFGMWVFGGEFSYSSDINNINSVVISGSNNFLFSNSVKDLMTVGARAGYAGWTNFLLYGEGGYAQAHVGFDEVNVATGGPLCQGLSCSASADTNGYYAGAGLDYMLWKGQIADAILGAEYRHVGLSSRQDPSFSTTSPFVTYGTRNLDIAQVRLTIKLNPWGTVTAPVVAKY